MTFRQTLALVLCGAIAMSGCASAGGPRVADTPAVPVMDQAVLADYVQRLPAGSRVRIERVTGDMVRGTLMKATPDGIVVQKNTRVPETPTTIPLAQVARVTLEQTNGHSTAMAIWAGVGVAFSSLFVLSALLVGGS
ncbi:MAG TPA: hypothetical protein VEL79_08615 [Vicinamibacterales bacterium]|nr:hypothetical protein [Vicinamibacterales bacterium]